VTPITIITTLPLLCDIIFETSLHVLDLQKCVKDLFIIYNTHSLNHRAKRGVLYVVGLLQSAIARKWFDYQLPDHRS